eukprot:g5085.t1
MRERIVNEDCEKNGKTLKDDDDLKQLESWEHYNLTQSSKLIRERPENIAEEQHNVTLWHGLEAGSFCVGRSRELDHALDIFGAGGRGGGVGVDVRPEDLRGREEHQDLMASGEKTPLFHSGVHSAGGTSTLFYGTLVDGFLEKLEENVSSRQKKFEQLEIVQKKRAADRRRILDARRTGGEDKNQFREKGLWVDRYAPRTYLDLVSDENTNKIVLEWISAIEKLNFGQKLTAPTGEKLVWKPWGYQKVATEGGEGGEGNGGAEESAAVPRILLLGGPPGVLGRLKGYRVEESNCSELRSAHEMASRVRSVCNLGEVYGQRTKKRHRAAPIFENGVELTEKEQWMRENKAPLLILDEIDGIGKSVGGDGSNKTIAALLKLVDTDRKEKDCTKWLIRSPVIAICNDLKSKALAELKKYAQVVEITGSQANVKLKNRLKEIVRAEKVKVQEGALVDLVRECNADIRACLNALQLLYIDNKTIREYLARGTLKEEHAQILDLYKCCMKPLALREGKNREKAKVAVRNRILHLAKDFDFRPVATDFLRHAFGVSFRHRAAATAGALSRFSYGEFLVLVSPKDRTKPSDRLTHFVSLILDALAFRQNAWELKSYTLSLPLLYASQHCAPEGANSQHNKQRFKLRKSDKHFDCLEKRRNGEAILEKLRNPPKEITKPADVMGAAAAASFGEIKTAARSDRSSKAAQDHRGSMMLGSNSTNTVAGGGGAAPSAGSAIDSEQIYAKMMQVLNYRSLHSTPNSVKSRELSLLAICLRPEESGSWFKGLGPRAESRFPNPADVELEITPGLQLCTATRLMSDCFLRWQFDEWTEKLHLQPCVPELVYPYWNSFDEDLTSLLDEKVADGKRRKIELRNAVFQKETEVEVKRRLAIAMEDLNQDFRRQHERLQQKKRDAAQLRLSAAMAAEAGGSREGKVSARGSGKVAKGGSSLSGGGVGGGAGKKKKKVREEKNQWGMFGLVVKKQEGVGSKEKKLKVKKAPVWLQYLDGHTKAVYRPMRMARFLS